MIFRLESYCQLSPLSVHPADFEHVNLLNQMSQFLKINLFAPYICIDIAYMCYIDIYVIYVLFMLYIDIYVIYVLNRYR